MNNGTGEITVKMFYQPGTRIISYKIHPGGSIGMHLQEKSNDINYVLSGKGKAVCNGVEEELVVGCLKSDQGKPEHCRKCGIKDGVVAREITSCFECSEYPCKQIKRLEKSYNTRYQASLMENIRMVKEQGLDTFLQQQKERHICLKCGGIISIHDVECSECQYKM